MHPCMDPGNGDSSRWPCQRGYRGAIPELGIVEIARGYQHTLVLKGE